VRQADYPQWRGDSGREDMPPYAGCFLEHNR